MDFMANFMANFMACEFATQYIMANGLHADSQKFFICSLSNLQKGGFPKPPEVADPRKKIGEMGFFFLDGEIFGLGAKNLGVQKNPIF